MTDGFVVVVSVFVIAVVSAVFSAIFAPGFLVIVASGYAWKLKRFKDIKYRFAVVLPKYVFDKIAISKKKLEKLQLNFRREECKDS